MTALVVLVVMTFLASLVHLIPGDPVKTILGPRADPELSKIVRHDMQLDLPVPQQVWNFVTGAVRVISGSTSSATRTSRGSSSTRFRTRSCSQSRACSWPCSSAFRSASTRRRTRTRWIGPRHRPRSRSRCITIPPYLAGLFFVLIFAVQLPGAACDRDRRLIASARLPKHLILPAIALGITWIGYFARLVRASMLEVLNANYIRTAQAFGMHER